MQRLQQAFKKKFALQKPVFAGAAPPPPAANPGQPTPVASSHASASYPAPSFAGAAPAPPPPAADPGQPTPAASSQASASYPALPPGAFAGWDAEEQLSACWGSDGGSFCSTASGAPPPCWPPTQRPSSGGGSWSAGGQVQGRAHSTCSRPGSAGGQYVCYTVRHEKIEEAPASGSSCAEEQDAEDGDSGTAPSVQHSGGNSTSASLQGGAQAAWGGAYQPAAGRDALAGWVPTGSPPLPGGLLGETAADASEGGEACSEGQPELEDEPSAPPLPCDEPWEASSEALPSPGKAVRFAEPASLYPPPRMGGGYSTAPAGYCSGGGGSPRWQELELPPCGTPAWGAAAAVRCGALAGEQGTAGVGAAEGFERAPAAAWGASPSRQVSEETPRYQALLETLAARRREAATAAAPAADAADGRWSLAAGQPSAAASRAVRPASSEGEAPGWQSPLLCSPTAAARAAARPAGTAPCTAKWAGVQTLLGNLHISASASHTAPPPPGTSFWDLPSASDEHESPPVPVPAAAAVQPAPWSGAYAALPADVPLSPQRLPAARAAVPHNRAADISAAAPKPALPSAASSQLRQRSPPWGVFKSCAPLRELRPLEAGRLHGAEPRGPADVMLNTPAPASPP